MVSLNSVDSLYFSAAISHTSTTTMNLEEKSQESTEIEPRQPDSRAEEERAYFKAMRTHCTTAVEFVTKYLETISDRTRIFPLVEPGFLRSLLPEEAPLHPEPMSDIFRDVERIVMQGVSHWNHPHFHAYFAAANSYPAICGDIITSSIGGIGFTWAASPISTELEVVMVDWMAKLLGLPEFFLFNSATGGGVIQTTSSESIFVTLLAARNNAIDQYQATHPGASKFEAMEKLVGYHSEHAHASAERAGLLSLLRLRALPTNDRFEMTGETFRRAVETDIANGLQPFYCLATFGTTGTCSFDKVDEIGPVCEKHGIWLHVDAAYAGSALICPEFRHLMPGLEYASSFSFNPHKWLLINFDCSMVWYKHAECVVREFTVNAAYLNHNKLGKMPDYRNWHIPFGRRARAIKAWFVLRSYGVTGLQKYIRNHVNMAYYLKQLIEGNPLLEVIGNVTLGLVCFRMKGENDLTRDLYEKIEDDGRIHLVTTVVQKPNYLFIIRVAICYMFIDQHIIETTYSIISEMAEAVNGCRMTQLIEKPTVSVNQMNHT